ncbi:MAG: prenyltransferase [Chloroflexi bacterium]|nr:prenyltransferase [Chloroflexota bacterium]
MGSPVQSAAKVSFFRRTLYFIQLGRPLHLVGGFVFNSLGIAIALFLGATINWTSAIWCQLAITATQLMTHYSNDYFDQDADVASLTPTRWASGSRILPRGLVQPHAALIGALVFGGIALAATVVLTVTGQSPFWTGFLLLLAIFLAWNYSSPPLWLNRRGLGEITGAILVPGVTVLLSFQVQTGGLARLPLLAIVPLCFFQFAMLLSVNFPDVAGDMLVNKRTLVVIYGPKRISRLFLVVLACPYLLLPLLVWLGLPTAVVAAVLLTFPLAGWLGWRISQGAATEAALWDGLAFWSMGLLVGGAVLETAVFLMRYMIKNHL